uniref:Uncharacterized protein n=1 Tax=Ditylenchus dipsaci TaxID=166011 RepID=A0A915DSB7_9BILA
MSQSEQQNEQELLTRIERHLDIVNSYTMFTKHIRNVLSKIDDEIRTEYCVNQDMQEAVQAFKRKKCYLKQLKEMEDELSSSNLVIKRFFEENRKTFSAKKRQHICENRYPKLDKFQLEHKHEFIEHRIQIAIDNMHGGEEEILKELKRTLPSSLKTREMRIAERTAKIKADRDKSIGQKAEGQGQSSSNTAHKNVFDYCGFVAGLNTAVFMCQTLK